MLVANVHHSIIVCVYMGHFWLKMSNTVRRAVSDVETMAGRSAVSRCDPVLEDADEPARSLSATTSGDDEAACLILTSPEALHSVGLLLLRRLTRVRGSDPQGSRSTTSVYAPSRWETAWLGSTGEAAVVGSDSGI